MTDQKLALNYLNSIVEQAERDAEAGTPFGVNDEGEEMTAYDWLEDVLDITYHVDGNGQYRGAEVLTCVGGPTAYLETRHGVMTVSWDETVEEYMPLAFTEPLDEALRELWEMSR